MTDDELIRAFEDATLPAERFTHAEHVRAAWIYLRRHSLPEALVRFVTALRAFAHAKGVPDLYHETVTVAFMLVIAERLATAPDLDWPAFASRNADLLQWKPSVLNRYYSESVLWSERAKRGFVMPDRIGPPFPVPDQQQPVAGRASNANRL